MKKKKPAAKDQAVNEKSKSRNKIAAENDTPGTIESAAKEILPDPISSAELLKSADAPVPVEPLVPQFAAVPESEETDVQEIDDPVFLELATPKLPELKSDNRARLLMQSPTRIQFYWSMLNNPFQVLGRALGDPGSYTLVAKLINESSGREEIVPVEPEGSYWFKVESDSVYRAEIGFYAPNRPYVRIMFSNTLETPRKRPSSRQATDADWAVTADQFADVLESTGFSQDAVEVALAGDDRERSADATGRAFSQLIGAPTDNHPGFSAEEVRFALLALASGFTLEDLRGQIGAALFAVLQDNSEKLSAELALASLGAHFDISFDEIDEEELVGAAVFGASLVHFPRSARRKRLSPKILIPRDLKKDLAERPAPVSSLRVG